MKRGPVVRARFLTVRAEVTDKLKKKRKCMLVVRKFKQYRKVCARIIIVASTK